ncbi:MAG: ATP-dependent Clp protease ATP-binding subunit [Saprospirales bacterium]|nr:ATP-dependent Clp protease ATP-binding subunit [Saprospirales bacterium]
MAYSITIPFHAVKLRFISGGDVWLPLLDKQALRVGTNLETLAQRYSESLQKELLNGGQFQSILHEYQQGPYEIRKLSVHFKASENRFTHPAFELDFDYILRRVEGRGFWGLIPATGGEAFSLSEEDLEKSLQEVVRLDFSRNHRLIHLQRVVSLIWYDSVEVESTGIKAIFPTPKEQQQSPALQQESWLGKVAFQPRVSRPSAYGREQELQKFARTLKSPYIKNVLLLGPNGVGKTALVKELIRQKAKLGIQEEIWETTASMMIKELSTDMGWQENLSQLCKELKTNKAILFVRNLNELFEVGKYEGNTVSLADYLLPYLSKGEITLIGECTSEEKALIELNSPSYLGHFQLLHLEEPTAMLEEIIVKKVNDIASDQKVELPKDAIEELIRLNRRYTPYAGFPGKPIRFLESLLLYKKSVAKDEVKKSRISLGKSEIIRHFCMETGMPPFMVDPAIPVDFEQVRSTFDSNVFGQGHAVDSLINVLSSVKTGMNRSGKPIASFLFVGPTGVGKTELVKVLAQFMFGSRERLTRFDMSEFSTAYAVRNLIGSGAHSEGLLTSAVRREPFGVLLFDEVEKAHPSFFDYLLQVLSEGRLTDSRGQIANFCSTMVILTSNIGASKFQTNRIGWKKTLETQVVNQHFLHSVQQFFRPEMFNRIDQVIAFQPLSRETMRQVVNRELQLLKTREGIRGRKLTLEMGDDVLDYLAEKGFNPLYGARYLQRTMQTELAIPLAQLLNQRDSLDHVLINVKRDKDRLDIQAETDPLSMELLMEELEKFNLANLSSDKRKEVQRLEDGASYLKLVNELAILDREKEKQPQLFYRSKKKSQLHDQYSKSKARFKLIKQQAEKLEADISMACMGFNPYQPDFSTKLDSWKSDWESYLEDLFLQLFPGDACWLSIYGKPQDQILRCYLQIIEKQDYKIEGYSIWLTPLSRSLPSVPEPDTRVITPSGNEFFYLRPWDTEKSWLTNLQASDSDEVLYGVQWEIKGPGAWWFLKGESGFQRWDQTEKEHLYYSVQVSTQSPHIPNTIHRLDYYLSQAIRRTVVKNSLSDTAYKLKEAYFGHNLGVYLHSLLKDQFEETVKKELLF